MVSTADSADPRLTRSACRDESAFLALVERYHGSLARVAMLWVDDPALVQRLIEKTWRSMLYRLDRFDSQQSLKAWLCRVLIALALEAVGPERGELHVTHEAAVPAERFSAKGERWEGHWQRPPEAWPDVDVEAVLQRGLGALLHAQRVVLVLRDVEQLTAAEVQSALGLSEQDQRQLLHQAHSRLRATIEQHHEQSQRRPT